MSYAAAVIEKFGGIRPMAEKMILPPSTVQGWKDSGIIPARRQPDILARAQELKIELQPSDFFPIDSAGGKPGHRESSQQNHRSQKRAGEGG